MERESVRFPSSGHIWVPISGRRSAAAGLSLHSPCKPIKVLAQRTLYLAVRAFGPAVLPGERASWGIPLPEDQWREIVQQWRAEVGGFDAIALYRRPQLGRSGFAALLLREGRGVGFVRFHPDASRVNREFRVVTGVWEAGPTSFSVARPIASSELAWGGAWLLSESLPNYPLGAVRRETVRHRVVAEVGEVLSSILPREAGTPAHWVAVHGDLSPWNMRTLLSGDVRVIDWEDATYAPPGVDQLYADLTAQGTFGTGRPTAASAEAVDWLHALIRGRGKGDIERADRLMLDGLARVPRL